MNRNISDPIIREELDGVQQDIVRHRETLRHIGVSTLRRLTKTIIDRFDRCIDWRADMIDYGYDRREKFLSVGRHSKLFLMSSGAFPFKDPLPKLRTLKRRRA